MMKINVNEKAKFKRKLFNIAALSTILLIFSVSLSVIMLTTTKGQAIGWGLTLGVPLLLGFYAGLFAKIGETISYDPKAHGCNGIRILKYTVYFGLFIITSTFGFFLIDTLIKGSGFSKSMSVAFSGSFCMVMAVVVFMVPITIGVTLAVTTGKSLRKYVLRKSGINIKNLMLLLVVSLFLPPSLDFIEGAFGLNKNLKVEKIILEDHVAASVPSLFKNIEFFMDHTEMHPLIYKLGFPKLIKTIGVINKVGDEVLCVFSKGHIIKKVSRLYHLPHESLIQFDVIEQNNIENRSVELTRGTFKLKKIDERNTLLTLNAQYKPKMTPRWIWQPVEKFTVRALHNHILNSVRQNIDKDKIRLSSADGI